MYIFPGPAKDTGLFLYIPIVISLALLFNFLLITAVIKHRPPSSPWCLVLCSYSLACILYAVSELPMILDTGTSGTWPYDESWCKVRHVLLQSNVMIRAYHLPLMTSAVVFSSRYASLGTRARLLLPVVICACLWVCCILLALPVLGSVYFPEGESLIRRKCLVRNFSHYAIFNLAFIQFVPVVTSIGLLIKWACTLQEQTLTSGTPNTPAIVILICLHGHVLTQLPFWFATAIGLRESRDILWGLACLECVGVPLAVLLVPPFRDIFRTIWSLPGAVCQAMTRKPTTVVTLTAAPPSPD